MRPQLEEQSERTSEAHEPRASARAITMNFITGGLGSALFSLPWSVAGSSILTSIMIVAVVLLLNAWTISIVVRAGDRYNNFDLGSIVANLPHGLGAPLQAMTNLFVWISMFLCLVSSIIVMHDSAHTLVCGSWLDHRFLLVALASIFVLPLTCLNQRLLERSSSLAIAVSIYLFILIGVLYGRGVRNDSLPEGTCIFGSTIRGNFAMVTVMFQAVVVQMCVLPMYKALEDRSPERFDRIVAVGFTVLFFLFCGFSCIGYLLIGPDVQSNILSDLPKGTASSIAQVGTIVVVACVYPIMVYPMVAPIQDGEGTFFGLNRQRLVPIAKVVIVAAAMVVAARVPALGVVNVVNGAMSAMIFVALLPSVLGLALLDVSFGHKAQLRSEGVQVVHLPVLVTMAALNGEGEDLVEPLPVEWTLQDLQGMQVTLYGMQMSPPCAKLRMMFAFYKVPFASVNGKRQTGEYKKVPALDIGDRQINDSFIMIKSLAPILQGRPLTIDEVELERHMTYGLMVALEKDVAGNSGDLRSCGCVMGGGLGCVLWTMSCCIARVGPGKVGTEAHKFLGKPVGTISEYGQMLRNHLGTQDFLGGSAPQVIDVSVFGVLQPFDVAACACVDALLGPHSDPLRKWYLRMKEKTSDISIF